jgi:hypothetical protein
LGKVLVLARQKEEEGGRGMEEGGRGKEIGGTRKEERGVHSVHLHLRAMICSP